MSNHPSRPSLEFYKKQAKSLLKLFRARDPGALERIRNHHPEFGNEAIVAGSKTRFLLADAQLVIARENGLSSWAQLKEKIAIGRQGVSKLIAEWSDALNTRDLNAVETLLSAHKALRYQEFYPREKLAGYHAATYGPLLWAVWTEDYDIVRLLLEHGADPNHESQSCLPLLVASRDMSDLLFVHGADVNRYCVNGGTALMWGIGDIRRVDYLIDKGADVNLPKPNSGETPLMLLMGCDDENQSTEIARLLLKQGADVNARTRSGLDDEPIYNHGNDQNVSQGCMTALHLAAEFGRVRLTELLLRNGADPLAKTVSRRTIFFGPEDEPFPFEPFDGETPFDWAMRYGHAELIEQFGGDVLNDLYWAAAAGVQHRVETLLAQGADPNLLNDKTHRSPIDAAVAGKHRSVCQTLLAHGARWTYDIPEAMDLGLFEVVRESLASDPSLKARIVASPGRLLEWVQRADAAQRRILELIARTEPTTDLDIVVAIGLRDSGRIGELLEHRPSAFAAALKAVPELACWCAWRPDLLQMALEAGADVERRDQVFHGTPLHWAIKSNQLLSLRMLLKAGANPHATLVLGDAEATPLLVVVQQRSNCSLKLVEPLLRHGADPNWQMHNGYTALDIVNQRWGERPESEYVDAITVLRRYGGKSATELAIP